MGPIGRDTFRWLVLLVLTALHCHVASSAASSSFEAGAAMADITGPVAQTSTMGYAHASLSGLHTRLFCRAFVFRDSRGNSAALAVLDLAMISHLLSFTVGKRLSVATDGRYSEQNVMLSATHTHAGPSGYNQDLFLALSKPGFDREYFEYIVDGVVQSVLTADGRRAPAVLLSNSGNLYNASVNRHPYQYLLNPAAERAIYADNVDREMHLLRIDNALTGAAIGSVAWFPVHGTSLKLSNRYVCGDNKGIASLLMERHFEPAALPGGSRTFVAAFPQSNSGDVTPNTEGIFRFNSTEHRCNATVLNTFECESRGPGSNQYESAMIIGRMQFQMALRLFRTASWTIRQPEVATIHDSRRIDAESFPPSGSIRSAPLLKPCSPAIGYAFCAGTTDGKGLFSYFTIGGKQRPSVLVDLVRDASAKVTQEDAECHGSKRICLNLGKMKWSGIPFMSSLIPTQILRLGPIFIAALPSEITTMAGRRLVKSLSSTPGFPADGKVQINGLSNGYFFYVTTEEEYSGTYYEAGATLFGPNTLKFYAWHMGRMLAALLGQQQQHQQRDHQFRPLATPDNLDKSRQLEGLTAGSQAVLDFDFQGFRSEFGQQTAPLNASYMAGDTVRLEFVACNPRHSLAIRGHSFVLVERYSPGLHEWRVVDTDAGLDTRFFWRQGDFFQSHAIVHWSIPMSQRSGHYRVQYLGHCRPLTSPLSLFAASGDEQPIRPVNGTSKRFWVYGRRDWVLGPEIPLGDFVVTAQRRAAAPSLARQQQAAPGAAAAVVPSCPSLLAGAALFCVAVIHRLAAVSAG